MKNKSTIHKKKCIYCGKELESLSLKQLRANFDMHVMFCKNKKKEKKQ